MGAVIFQVVLTSINSAMPNFMLIIQCEDLLLCGVFLCGELNFCCDLSSLPGLGIRLLMCD